MKPIFVLYEGPQDGAFVGRLLKVAKVKPYERPLDQYQPSALSKFLIRRYERRDVAGGRFRPTGRNKGTVVQEWPPIFEAAYELTNPSRLLLFHRCVGDSDHGAVGTFLSELVDLAKPGAKDMGLPSFGVLFVRDADDRGIEARVAELRTEYADILKPVLPRFVEMVANNPAAIVREADFSAGCCIFTSPNKDTGTLEDIVLPLLECRISQRLTDARQYVAIHGITGTEVARGDNPSAKRLKAVLTIACQVDAPGYSLSVALRDTPAFEDAVIGSHSACQLLTRMVLEI